MNLFKRKKAFSLFELILAMGLFSLVAYSLVTFTIDSVRFNENRWHKVQSGLLIQEMTNALLMNKNDLWQSVVSSTNTGAKHMEFSSNTYQIINGTQTSNGITTSFQIGDAYRDSNNQIVTSGGTIDVATRSVTMTTTWTDKFGSPGSVNSTIYISNWNTLSFSETTTADFNDGTNSLTYVDSTNGGEVRLETVVYADWCNPSITSSSYDLPGQGVAQAITAISGHAFVGTGSNASGLSFAHAVIDNNDPPNVTVPATFDGYKTNAVFGESNYGYVATDTNSKEVVIINIASTPYTESGYFDAPGNGSGLSIYVSNNKGYMISGSHLYIFDLSSKTGSRPLLGSALLTATGKKVVVNGNYAYVALSSSITQLQIIDISNPALPLVVGTAVVAGGQARDIYVNATATRAYLATAVSSTQKEFFILDISTKIGVIPTLGSYETNGMDPKGGIIVPDGYPRAIVVGTSGEEYQVINTQTESAPVHCGGAQIDVGVNDIAAVVDLNGTAYSYILTASSSAELRIIKGGPGGGDPTTGQGYPTSGNYTSNVLDTNASMTTFYTAKWTPQIPSGGDIKLQIRAGNTSNLSSLSWIGPDGTGSTYFTTNTGQYLPNSINNNRYIQYKIYFTSNKLTTPVFQDVKINYQK